jgi:hypothetical protein
VRYEELDEVVLNKDLPEHGLSKGDLGVVVQVYEPDGIEVEFVRVSGATQALVTLRADDVIFERGAPQRTKRQQDQIQAGTPCDCN